MSGRLAVHGSRSPSRRAFLTRAGGVAGLAVLAPGLAACGTDDHAIRFQLGWLPNVESMAMLVADAKGYFRQEGVRLRLAPGGPTVVIEPQIITDKVLAGVITSDKLADAVAKGAPLVAVGACYQRSPSCILSRADHPIRTPKDLEGKRFGLGQSDARVYSAFFRLADVDERRITLVPTATDPSALAAGEVDAISATLPRQPVALAIKGVRTVALPLADYGYNRWSGLLTVRAAHLRERGTRRQIRGILRATIRGMQDAVADPREAARIVVARYGQQIGLDPTAEERGARIWARLARTPQTRAHGLLRLTRAGIASQRRFLAAIGVHADVDRMFDPSLINEIYGDTNHV